MSLFRFIYIIYIALKYRLDQFFSSRTIKVIQFILAPLRLISFTKLNRAERLRISLESLGPIFVKFGQMLSTRRDLLPTDIADELALPPVKIHCSVLAEDAIKAAIDDYKSKQSI